METFNNRLQAFWIPAGKQEKAIPAISGFVHPSQKHKFLFDGLLRKWRFCKTDKTGQAIFHLSKTVCLLSKIICISIYCVLSGRITFAVGKIT
ncbi:MAG: hypothetical protein LBD21_09200 [Tannerellaceae bacterium]|jgi:hypothetical protein|nr:hypothetical protein [Tannerellaceae bacterium]